MPSPRTVLSALIDPRGRTGRGGYAGAIVAVMLVCLAAAPFGPFVLVGVGVAAWVFLSTSARRIRDVGAPGRMAIAPFIVALRVALASIWFSLVTKAFCQGYCAGAKASDIAALDWLERSAAPIVGWTFLAFVVLLLALPGRRPAGDLTAASG